MENLPMTHESHVLLEDLRANVMSDSKILNIPFEDGEYLESLLDLKEEQCLVIFDDRVVPTTYGINLYT